MKHYVLIEVDTEHALLTFVSAEELAALLMGEIIAGGNVNMAGVSKMEMLTLDELHTQTCLLMDGVA